MMDLLPELEKMPLSPQNVFLDIQNPRFIGDRGAPVCKDAPIDDSRVQERARRFLLEKHGARQLVDSILQLGFLPLDHIVVREFAPNKYVVVEGNRRVAAIQTIVFGAEFKLLKPEQHVLESIKRIEMYKLSDATEDIELATLLFQGVRHISGVKSWGPYQQGRLAATLVSSEKMTFKEAAASVGLSPSRVAMLIRGYYGMYQFLHDEIYAEKADTSMFSFFEYAHARMPIREWLGWDDVTNRYTNKDALHFFYDCIISSEVSNPPALLSRHVRDYLPQVLEKKKEKKHFIETKDIRSAYRIATADSPSYYEGLKQVASVLTHLESSPKILSKEDIVLLERLNLLTEQLLQKHR